MDNKTFMAAYVAQESTRVKDALKDMVERGTSPSEEEKEALMQDMQTSLMRLQKVLEQIQQEVQAEESEESTEA